MTCCLSFTPSAKLSEWMFASSFFFQAEDGIRDLVRSRGLGDVYKRQIRNHALLKGVAGVNPNVGRASVGGLIATATMLLLSLIHI